MAQGKMRVSNSQVQKKAKHQNKVFGTKKGGGRKIAPKKKQKIKERNIKLHLQKSINATIENELAQKAGHSSLAMVKGQGEVKDKKSGKVVTNDRKSKPLPNIQKIIKT